MSRAHDCLPIQDEDDRFTVKPLYEPTLILPSVGLFDVVLHERFTCKFFNPIHLALRTSFFYSGVLRACARPL
ncbi:hypothetical protein WN51_04693 [Melipona quadrifasciata]|uniref:Uncharacterized protein n=1 Tax=Melipona quadrifasciata TaxID=166423 RepID=A0A0N0U7J1_9HYME|nr:hypothetical protein WN51_04693 [Melipona quadrifasciata]